MILSGACPMPVVTWMLRPLALVAWCAAQLSSAGPAVASSVLVPDQVSSIQAAIDSRPDTVLVRPGWYPERLRVSGSLVLRRLAPDGSGERAEVEGFDHGVLRASRVITEGFAFRGARTEIFEYGPALIEFIACRFDSGITATVTDHGTMRLSRCVVSVDAHLRGPEVRVDSSELRVPLRVEATFSGGTFIRGNLVEGAGAIGIQAVGDRCEAEGNRVTGYDRGIVLQGDHLVLRGNTVQGSDSLAMDAHSLSTLLAEDNIVANGRGGIRLAGSTVTTRRNRVSGTATVGIDQGGDESVAEGNTVIACTAGGIRIQSGYLSRAEGNIVEGCTTSGAGSGGPVPAPRPGGAGIAGSREPALSSLVDYGISAIGGLGCELVSNRVIGFDHGVAAYADHVTMQGNLVSGSTGPGIRGWGEHLLVEDNTVAGCYEGIVLDAILSVTTRRNRVSGAATFGIDHGGYNNLNVAEANSVQSCSGGGIRLGNGENSRAEGNVVGRCGGIGIYLHADLGYSVKNNTCYLNASHGISIAHSGDVRAANEVIGNIGYRNAGAGLSVFDADSIGCNDWFENGGGAIVGQPAAPGDVALDPIFCDLANDDVTLRADSPLLAPPGCERIGALGQGCDAPSPTLVTRFTASAVPAGIEVRWQVSHSGDGYTAWLERADRLDGPWQRVESERTVEGEVTVELDRGVEPGRTYWYRLFVSEGGGRSVLGPPLEVAAGPPPGFGLLGLGPNPARGPVWVEFGLARAATVELDVYDIQGRHVAVLANGAWPAGRHRVVWPAVSGKQDGASGLFLVRYRYPGGSESRRFLRAE